MIFLSGAVRPELRGRRDAGWMLTPMMGNRPNLTETFWAADNGCFARPESFSLSGYYEWLASHAGDRQTCLFVVAPDVVGDARATLKKASPVMPVIRALGFPVAFVAQDNVHAIDVPWDAFDCLFMGGTNPFRKSAYACAVVDEARRRGKWVHKGRVNSRQHLMAATAAGFDSADGTYAAFGPDINTPKMLRWIAEANSQMTLELVLP